MRPYEYEEGRLIVQEMTDLLVLDLVDKGLMCNAVVLTVSYDNESLNDPEKAANYEGNLRMDYYGRIAPEHAHGTANFGEYTSSSKKIINAMMELYDRIVDPALLVRRVNVVAVNTVKESEAPGKAPGTATFEQMDLFTDYSALEAQREEDRKEEEKEKQLQHAVLDIKKKFGKNAILKGMNLQKGAMTRERNNQVGGHKA
jgi:DNA polymerase V